MNKRIKHPVSDSESESENEGSDEDSEEEEEEVDIKPAVNDARKRTETQETAPSTSNATPVADGPRVTVPEGFMSDTHKDFRGLSKASPDTELWLVRLPHGFEPASLNQTLKSSVLADSGSQSMKVRNAEGRKQYFAVHSYKHSSEYQKMSVVVNDSGTNLALGRDVENMLVVTEVFKVHNSASESGHRPQTVKKRVPVPEGLKVRFTTFGTDSPVPSHPRFKKSKKRKKEQSSPEGSPELVRLTPSPRKRAVKMETTSSDHVDSTDTGPHLSLFSSPKSKKRKLSLSVEESHANTGDLILEERAAEVASPLIKKHKKKHSDVNHGTVFGSDSGDGVNDSGFMAEIPRSKHKKEKKKNDRIDETGAASFVTDTDADISDHVHKKSKKKKKDRIVENEDASFVTDTDADVSVHKKHKKKKKKKDRGGDESGDDFEDKSEIVTSVLSDVDLGRSKKRKHKDVEDSPNKANTVKVKKERAEKFESLFVLDRGGDPETLNRSTLSDHSSEEVRKKKKKDKKSRTRV